MSPFLFGLIAIAIIVVAILIACYVLYDKSADTLESLGVSKTYPRSPLPGAKIDAYLEFKEKLRGEFTTEEVEEDQTWMSALPPRAKDELKYRLMHRAIGDMACLQKIDSDSRGYWRLFSKGMVTRTFWESVMEAERDLSAELEAVKVEASCVEPRQDPQGIISEAMQFILRHGDKMPCASDIATSADAMSEIMKQLPTPGAQPKAGMPPGGMPGMPPGMGPQGMQGMPPGMQGMPPGMQGMPPGMGPPGHPGMGPPGMGGPPPMKGPNAAQQVGGEEDAYAWKQDTDEVEVSVSVPATATKAQVKVNFGAKKLKVELAGTALIEGALASPCVPDGCTWTISKGRLVISLEKADPRPWPKLFAAKA